MCFVTAGYVRIYVESNWTQRWLDHLRTFYCSDLGRAAAATSNLSAAAALYPAAPSDYPAANASGLVVSFDSFASPKDSILCEERMVDRASLFLWLTASSGVGVVLVAMLARPFAVQPVHLPLLTLQDNPGSRYRRGKGA